MQISSQIYQSELENQPEYNGFKEWLLSFDLYRGKKTGDDVEDENRVVGTFKGAIKVYKWPLPKDVDDHTVMGFDPQNGFFQGYTLNDFKTCLQTSPSLFSLIAVFSFFFNFRFAVK